MPDVGAARMLSPKIVGQTRLLELRGEEEPMDLRTVNAVITGGASGLGRATAERIVKAGGRVALLDLPISKGADIAETLGGNAIFTPADVTHGEQVAGACEQARQRFGGVHGPGN